MQANEVGAVEPRTDVSYYSDHQSNTGTSVHSSQNSPDSLAPQPDPHHSTQTHPQNPDATYPTHSDPRYHPDSQYQPDPRYPSPTDPRFPSYTERLNYPDGRYPVQEPPVYPDGRYAVTPQRRPPPPVLQTPVHHHTSGPGVRESTNFSLSKLQLLS